MIYLQPKIYFITIILLISLFTIFICIYLYIRRRNKNRRREVLIDDKRPICPSTVSTSAIPSHFIFPTNIELSSQKISETYPQFSLNEIPSNYKTFDLSKRTRQHYSSDSSYESSTNPHVQSYSFGTIKSKIQKIYSTSSQNSDSDDIDNELTTSMKPSFEYSLLELFRIELIYKLSYSLENKQLRFEILHLIPIQTLIEQCFSSLTCKIRLFINNDKHKTKKFLTKKNPINELFQFDLEEYQLEKSYLKIHILGNYQNDKRMELGQTVLVINQYDHLINNSEQYKKLIQIYEERIDMIIREQTKNENDARALICLVYENDRCLLHVGLIKILGIQYLLKQPLSHFHHRGIFVTWSFFSLSILFLHRSNSNKNFNNY